jgi:thymidylate synthase
MKVFSGRNVNELYMLAMNAVGKDLDGRDVAHHPSRNGPMVEFMDPVTSVYWKPRERVLFDATRDCNPFLHFFESLWMLAGRNDLAFLTQFTKNMANFSDDGATLNGAYGHRWRHHFKTRWMEPEQTPGEGATHHHEDFDQLAWAIYELQQNPNSRRVVIQMWNGNENHNSKDIPCNTSVMWKLRHGVLDMTVTNRSNDMIWGCYGANAVHFSFLHEYVASSVGAKVGTYYQVSNSLHCYPELDVTKRCFDNVPPYSNNDPYKLNEVNVFPLFWGGATQLDFDSDLLMFFEIWNAGGRDFPAENFQTAFFREVVTPMWDTFWALKHGGGINDAVQDIAASDWQRAVQEWLQRRGKV